MTHTCPDAYLSRPIALSLLTPPANAYPQGYLLTKIKQFHSQGTELEQLYLTVRSGDIIV